MNRILCLDLGDVWVGIALSDPSQIIAAPLTTVKRDQLESELEKIFNDKTIDTVVVGYPKTMKGTISAQTQKIIDEKEILEKKFDQLKWLLWDERLSSKHAAKLKKTRTKEEKIKSHALAAAFILDTYLQFLHP